MVIFLTHCAKKGGHLPLVPPLTLLSGRQVHYLSGQETSEEPGGAVGETELSSVTAPAGSTGKARAGRTPH